MPFHARASPRPRTSTPQVPAWLPGRLSCMLCFTACRCVLCWAALPGHNIPCRTFVPSPLSRHQKHLPIVVVLQNIEAKKQWAEANKQLQLESLS